MPNSCRIQRRQLAQRFHLQLSRSVSEYSTFTPESALHRLKSLVLVFLGRYCDISVFSFAADCHFYLSPFHFRLLPRRLTQSTFAKTRQQRAISLLIIRHYGNLHISNKNATANSLLCTVYQECCLSWGTTLKTCCMHAIISISPFVWAM